jgi:CDP-diacylglycerol--serine O-phosphatidyltransferase
MKEKTKDQKQRQGRWKKRRLKYIAILPSLITLMNGMCGFIAIMYASRGPGIVWQMPFLRRADFSLSFFALSGYMIFFAMIADVMDGRVARLSKTTSSFGGQLDSLCDAVSFGVAPAFLMVKLVDVHFNHLRLEGMALTITGRAVMLAALVYAMCAVIRLARFNVENQEDESAHMNFDGLPSPPAAGVVVSLVVFQQDFLPVIAKGSDDFFRIYESVTVWALPFVTFVSGLLMVSRIRYPHVANYLLRGKKSFSTFLAILFAGLLIIWNIQLAMVAGFCGFVLFGLVRAFWTRLFRKKRQAAGIPAAGG